MKIYKYFFLILVILQKVSFYKYFPKNRQLFSVHGWKKKVFIITLFIILFTSCVPGRSSDDPNKNNDGLLLGILAIPNSKPSNLSYSFSDIILTLGENISITPTVDGVVRSFSINPTLPQGLSFSSSTGNISGIPVAVQIASNYTVSASNSLGSISLPLTLTVATKFTFNDGSIPSGWISSGGANWQITSSGCEAGYGSCLRSGPIGNSSSTSVAVTASTSYIKFRWNVSSQSCCDGCRFYIDRNNFQSASIFGSPGWAVRQFGVSRGFHTFRWEYSKNSSGSSGLDTCFIDEVQFVPE